MRQVAALLILLAPAASAQILELEKAKSYFAEGQYDECLLVLGRLEDEPEVAREALGLRIRALRTVGRYEEAVTAARTADPRDVEARLELVVLARIRGRTDEAIAEIARILEIEPEHPGALANRGLIDLEAGRVDEAMKSLHAARERYLMTDLESAASLYWAGVAARVYGMRATDESRTEALSLVTESILPEALERDPTLYEATHAMGSIWVDAFDHPYAKENYEKALARNPRHPDLLAGMAATHLLRFGSRPEAVPLLEKALATNPHHAEALCLLASVRLHDEEYEGTKDLLDRALAVNPNDQDALALLAGYHWLHGDRAASQAVERRVLELNPACGDFYYVLAQTILTKRQFHESVDLLKKAIELDPTHWHAYIELGTNLMRIGVGREKEARPYLEKAMKEFPYHVQSKNLLTLLRTYDEYVLAAHGDVHARLHVSEDPLMRPYVERFLDECVADLEARYDFEMEGPVLFELFHDHNDFAVRSVGLTGLGALGVCFGQVVTMDGPAARKGQFNWKATAWHEFAHVLTLQRSKYRIPRWFTEGLSGLEEKRRNPAWLREQNLELYSAWSSGRMRGILDLNAGFTRPKYGNEVIVCYYQAALVCEYIEQVRGWHAVLKMIDAYADRATTEEVIAGVLGLDVKAFDAGFERYLEERYFGAMKVMPSFTRDDVEDLLDRIDIDPKDADAFARLAVAYLQQGRIADAELRAGQALALVRDLAAPHLVRGRILQQKGRHAQAREEIERGLELGGEDFHARLALGFIYRDVEKDLDKAARQFEAARDAFPRYVRSSNPYLLLADMRLQAGDKEGAVPHLEAYLSLEGEDYERRIELARIHLEAGRTDRAALRLREALETRIQDPVVHELLAGAERELGNLRDALFEYRALLEVSEATGHHRIYADMAEVHLALGDLPQARRMAEESLSRKADFEPARKVIEEIEKRE